MSSRRDRLYKLLAVGNRELANSRPGWCDEDYRLILKQCGARLVGDRYSATSMSESQLEAALARLKERGFRIRQPRSGASWRAPRIKKLNAMWCALADAGVVRNRSQSAMETFCRKRVRGMTQLQWATTEQLNQAVEELKQWCIRCGVEVKD